MTPNTPARCQTSPDAERPWQMSAVYVDDYILAAVENRSGTALAHTASKARILKYCIKDEKFCFSFRNNILWETQL